MPPCHRGEVMGWLERFPKHLRYTPRTFRFIARQWFQAEHLDDCRCNECFFIAQPRLL